VRAGGLEPADQQPSIAREAGFVTIPAHRIWSRMAGDERGVAAVEFAIIVSVVMVALLNAVDVAKYFFERMQVENAAQMGAQSAWATCDTTKLPATTNCSALSSAVSAAIQTTSLGSSVKLKSGSPAEGYYCVNSSNVLEYVSNVSSKPANCSSVGSASDQPGNYIQVQTTYTFKPIFPGLGIGSMLPTPITASALMRLQ
jgi:Flp pilus assembly protein TadG